MAAMSMMSMAPQMWLHLPLQPPPNDSVKAKTLPMRPDVEVAHVACVTSDLFKIPDQRKNKLEMFL